MWTYLTGVLQVVLIDLVLSGDNALVIGMACAALPPRSRRQGILLGSLAAIAMRVILASLAAVLLRIPLLQALGGLALMWVAFKLASSAIIGTRTAAHGTVKPGGTVWDAVRTIAVADLVMSLDNVLAVGGVSHGNLGLLLLGMGLTIPIIMWGSRLVASLMARAPWLAPAGALVLTWTAGGMLAADPALKLPQGPLMPILATAAVLVAAALDLIRFQRAD